MVHSYFHAYIFLKSKLAILGMHISCLGCLAKIEGQ